MSGKKQSAFTLIELLVVITILAILAGAVLPYVQNYLKESRISKTKADLEEIRKSLMIYETREGPYLSGDLGQLTGRYLNRPPVDPWGKSYVVATHSGTVFSCGPDRVAGNFDDISVNYQPPLALVQVKWVDANQTGAIDTQNAADYLQLFFSRKISPASDAIVNPATAHKYFSWTSASDIITSLDWTTLKLESSENMMTLRIADNQVDVFGPGSDTIFISDGAGLKDLSPMGNLCMASQAVIIAAQ